VCNFQIVWTNKHETFAVWPKLEYHTNFFFINIQI
jgi:hypothetical protein